jgi:3-phytase
VEIAPALETQAVASTNVDAADDPAIWAAPVGTTVLLNGETPGFIAGTDKKAGLYIFDLDGKQRQFLAEGLLNNVDLRDVSVGGRQQVVLGASDRGRGGVALYIYDPASTDPANAVRPWGFVKSDVTEPYGFCMGLLGSELHAILVGKDGEVRQYRIDSASGTPQGVEVRRFAVGSQSEGCVVDEGTRALYVGEELKGVWRYGFAPDQGAARTSIQAVDSSGILVADVEGVTLMRDGTASYLIVSSQGDSAFSVWRVDGAAPAYAGRFRVAAANGVDPVTGTDGLDALGGPVGPFSQGLVVVQDDENEGMTQNFKLIDWREIRRALELENAG